MIGEDYDMPLEKGCIEHPEWYDQHIDAIVDRFKFDVEEFKEKLINALVTGIKVELKLK